MATLRRSSFVHLLPLDDQRVLVVHAITQLRWPIDHELARVIEFFARPRLMSRALPALVKKFGHDKATWRRCIHGLLQRFVLSDTTVERERQGIIDALGPLFGRDPAALLEEYQRSLKEGGDSYWAVSRADGVEAMAQGGRRIDVLLMGDCEIQMESDFLKRAAQARGLDLRIAATFPSDVRLAGERAHDVVIIGALRSRHAVSSQPPEVYFAEARQLLNDLRALTQAPILIDNLPEPTVQPLGFADRSGDAHRNRFRRANLALADGVQTFSDVYVVDVAAALGIAGSAPLLDDALVSFTHFGSAGWMLQRPASEMRAVHNLFPDTAPLSALVGGNPYARESVVAQAHLDALASVLGIDAKKCVVVDLDGILWPGVLAETGAPFAWTPEISGAYSFVGLYFGIHEALKALKQRGLVLACVSKNDATTVQDLWHYPDHYPRDRLLSLDDFVTVRINWQDKASNIESIATELGFSLNAFLFIDDNPVERERVRATLPEVALLGDNLFTLRRDLLNDPRLQPPHLTNESEKRTHLVKQQLARAHARSHAPNEADFIATLDVVTEVGHLPPDAPECDRVAELFVRTTQFNTTDQKFSVAQLRAWLAMPTAHVFVMRVRDRFADHGLVAAAVVVNDVIEGLAMSCRVLGLGGVENVFLQHIIASLSVPGRSLRATLVETSRNLPVRNLYKDNGFAVQGEGVWTLPAAENR